MSLGKSLKKGFKKAKKSTRKAVNKASDATKDAANKTANVVKDTANKTADAATGAANTVANEVSREAQQATQQLEKLARDTAQLAERSYAEALAAGEAAWNEVVEFSERFLTDALVDLAEEMAEDVYRKHLQLIHSMAESGYALLTDPSTSKDVEHLHGKASRKQRDEDSDKTLRSLSESKSQQRVASDAQDKNLLSLSIGAGCSLSKGVGGEGCIGYAYNIPTQTQQRGFYGLGGMANVSFGESADNSSPLSMSFQLGAWTDIPSKLAGPYIAVSLEFKVMVGAGVQIIFKMPTTEKAWMELATSGKFELAGIVVFISGSIGGEVASEAQMSIGVSSGYTWVY